MKTLRLFAPTSPTEGRTLTITCETDSVGIDKDKCTWVRDGAQGELVWWSSYSRRKYEGDYYIAYEVG